MASRADTVSFGYCQDNDISRFAWSSVDDEQLAFTRRSVALRPKHRVSRRKRFLSRVDAVELSWYTPAGLPTTRGSLLVDDDFLVLIRGWWEGVEFTVPPPVQQWSVEFQTGEPLAAERFTPPGRRHRPLGPECIVVLRSPTRRGAAAPVD